MISLKSLLSFSNKKTEKEVKLVNLFLTQVILIISIIFIVVLFLWLRREYHLLNEELEQTQQEYIQTHKENIKKETERAVKYVEYKVERAETNIKNKLKNRVNLAYEIALNIYNQNINKKDINEIKNLIKIALEKARFENFDEYYFIGDLNGIQILFPPQPKYEGKNLYNLQDELGNYIIQDAIKVVKNKEEGFITNFWIHSESDTGIGSKKISYVKLFKPLNWYIGTGAFYPDFNKNVQQEVLEWLSNYRYGKEGYIFVNTYDGDALLMDGEVVKEKKNIWNLEDPNGVKVIQEERKAVKKPEGDFIYYSWRKLSSPEIRRKMSYVKGVPEWKWMIGAGVYIEEISEVLAYKKTELKKHIHQDIFLVIIWLSVLFLVLYLITFFLSLKTKSTIESFVGFFTNASHKSMLIDESKINFSEFKILARSANKMISEIKDSEIRKQEEGAHYDKLFEGSPEAIAFLNCDGKIQRTNVAFTNLFGFEQSEVINKDIDELLVPDELKEQALGYTKLIKDGSYEQIETIRKTKNKGKITVSIIGTPVSIDEKLLGYYAIYRDISKQKEFEQELYDSKVKAEESDRLKSSFLTNLSHEIRTPLNAIIGFSTLLNTKEVSKNEQKEYLRLLGNSGKLLLEIIDNIIDISKIESSTLFVNKINSNVNIIFDELLIEFSELKNNMNIDKVELMLFKEASDQELFVFTDQKRLKQVLSNLLDNALKFTDKGKVEFGYSTQENNLVCFVKDTGIGIDENELEFIFDSFRQADETTTRKYGGTGIGLALCKSIIKLLGGKLWVESKKGEGSQFYFTIPMEKTQQKQIIKPKDIESVDWSSKKILIAEDVEANYKLLESFLLKTNAILAWAKDGNQVIDMISNDPEFDLILMDINMPKMTGHEALQKLIDNGINIPVVAQTAYATDEQKHEILNLGYKDYILKPITLQSLLQKISKFLD